MGPPLAGPVILIAAGILLLLNNLGILPWAIWGDLWRLWPLALIAIGIDLIIGKRRPLVSLVIILLVLGVGSLIILYTGFATRGDLTAFNLNVPVGAARSADINIDFGTGELKVDGSANSESLASGSLDHYANRRPPRADLDLNDNRADLTIDAPDEGGFNFDWFGSSRSPQWDIHLNSRIPIALTADLGLGNSTLDLASVRLTRLEIDSGTGNTTVTLPQPASSVPITIDGGVGNLTLAIPEGAAARITVDTGIGNVNADSRFTKQGEDTWVTGNYATSTNKLDINIDAGVGNVDIRR